MISVLVHDATAFRVLAHIPFLPKSDPAPVVDFFTRTSNTAAQWRTQEFFSRGGGPKKIQLRSDDRESGDLGAVAP